MTTRECNTTKREEAGGHGRSHCGDYGDQRGGVGIFVLVDLCASGGGGKHAVCVFACFERGAEWAERNGAADWIHVHSWAKRIKKNIGRR